MRGFTLIELLLTVALVALLAAGGFAVRNGLVQERTAQAAAVVSLAAARAAQASAMAMLRDESWSVRMSSTSAIVFEGADWATRDAEQDRTYAFESVASTALTDVTFSKRFGVPVTDTEVVFEQAGASVSFWMYSDGRLTLQTN